MRTQALVWLGVTALSGCGDSGLQGTSPDEDSSQSDGADDGQGQAFAVTRLTPSSGLPEGSERVTFYGHQLDQVVAVRFGQASAQGLTPLGGTQLTVLSPPHPAGLVDLTLEHRSGQLITLPQAFLYRAGWVAESLGKTRASVQGGERLIIQGQQLHDDLVVLAGGRALTDLRVEASGALSGVLPARSACESADVVVTVSDRGELQTLSEPLHYVQDLKVVRMSRFSVPQEGHVRVRLEGSGLSELSEIWVGERQALIHTQTQTLVEMEVPAHPHGAADLTLKTPETTLHLPAALLYRSPSPETGALSLIAQVLPQAQAGSTLRLAFSGGLSLSGQRPELTLNGQTLNVLNHEPALGEVLVEVPASAQSGLLQVQLAGVQASLELALAPSIQLERVEPLTLPLSGGELTIYGRGFEHLDELFVDGKPAEILSRRAGEVRVKVAPSVSGLADIEARHAGGASSARLCEALEFRAEDAAFWGMSPQQGALSGGRVVRLWGQGFQQARPTQVYFGEQAVPVDLVSDHELIARAPMGDVVGALHVGLDQIGSFGLAWRYFDPTQPHGGTGGGLSDEALNITVLNAYSGTPVPNATVLIGSDFEGPYVGKTDERGQITFSDLYMSGPFEVSASASGHSTATVAGFHARDLTLRLYSLVIPPPSGGGGTTTPPQTQADGLVEGFLSGFDKYIVNPVGQCVAHLSLEHDLCSPCQADQECAGGACLYLEGQGSRCSDMCQSDGDCPDQFSCLSLDEGAYCVPTPGLREANCNLSQSSMFIGRWPLPAELFAPGTYNLATQPGEVGVLCIGGIRDPLTQAFEPLAMGLRRNVNVRQSVTEVGQDVALDVPLTRTLRVRFELPGENFEALSQRAANLFLELGAEGFFLLPQALAGSEKNEWWVRGLPERFINSLSQLKLATYAQLQQPNLELVKSSQVVESFEEISASGLWQHHAGAFTSAHLDAPVHALATVGDVVWAASSQGRLWRYQAGEWRPRSLGTPRGVLALVAQGDILWFAGEHGLFGAWRGEVFETIASPTSVNRATWRGLASDASRVWAWSDSALFVYEAETWRQLPLPQGQAPQEVVFARGDLWLLDQAHGLWRLGATWERQSAVPPYLTTLGGYEQTLWAGSLKGDLWRYTGTTWERAYSPVSDPLRAIAVYGPEQALASGDNGVLVGYDGLSWELLGRAPHLDGRAVAQSPEGPVLGGLPTWIIGPFLEPAEMLSPSPETYQLQQLRLEMVPPLGAQADFHWLRLYTISGFPFWALVTGPEYPRLQLPDFLSYANIPALYKGEQRLQVVRSSWDAFSMDAFTDRQLNAAYWRAWSITTLPVFIP